MTAGCTILLLEDEPLILMDLEYAAEDCGCTVLSAASCEQALALVASGTAIDVAILDVTLGDGSTCIPVARALEALCVPFILHSGDLDRHDERVRDLDARLIAKPAAADTVIAAAIIAAAAGGADTDDQIAAE